MTITFVWVVVALVVGGIEALGLVASEFHWSGLFWDAVLKLNGNFGALGYFIIGVFVLSWCFPSPSTNGGGSTRWSLATERARLRPSRNNKSGAAPDWSQYSESQVRQRQPQILRLPRARLAVARSLRMTKFS